MRISCPAVAAALCLSACGSAATPAVQSIDLKLMPAVSGTVTWNPTSQILVVQLSGSGLTPGAKHGLAAKPGSCASPQVQQVQFSAFTANVTGAVHQTLLSSLAVTSGLTSGSLQLLDASGSAIACTNLAGGDVVQFQPWPPYTSGSLVVTQNKIQLLITGLPPNTAHGAAIYSGSCDVQGAQAYKLKDLTADANGAAQGSDDFSTTGVIGPGSYLLVHAQDGSHLYNGDGTPGPGFAPVLCADLG